MKPRFEHIFKTSQAAHDKYLARLFGLFSEDVVLHWCSCPAAPYENLGRPTLWKSGKHYTLDFTLRRPATGETFVAEMKCWLEYDNYRYLRLVNAAQLQKIVDQNIAGAAFKEFLNLAADPSSFEVRVESRPLPDRVSGAILIWGATSDSGRKAVIAEYGFADVLSVETMLDDLHIWTPPQWTERINQLRYWSDELFSHLSARG